MSNTNNNPDTSALPVTSTGWNSLNLIVILGRFIIKKESLTKLMANETKKITLNDNNISSVIYFWDQLIIPFTPVNFPFSATHLTLYVRDNASASWSLQVERACSLVQAKGSLRRGLNNHLTSLFLDISRRNSSSLAKPLQKYHEPRLISPVNINLSCGGTVSENNPRFGVKGQIKDLENIIGSYLAGLIEGDGYISITNENRIILGITFNIKDKPLADKLLKYIGKGKGFIAKRKTNSIELRFSDKKSLYQIIELVNGKFRTPKIHQLYKLIDWMNKNHINSSELKINKLSIDNSSLNSNNWLAGFIDSDGGFYIRFSLKQIICKFALEQRMIYPDTKESYIEILEKICLFLNVKLHVRIRKNYKNNYYLVRVENQNSINLLISYLDKYPLLSSKHLDYLNWKKAFLIILSKKHFTEEGKKIIFTYKNTMNDKRDFFDWKHLNKIFF